MKKIFAILAILCFMSGCLVKVYADDDDYYEHHRHFHHSHYYDDDDYKHWRDDDDYDEWKEKRYKNWYKRCEKYGGIGCSYSSWHDREDWDDDDWEDYWEKRHYNRYHNHNYRGSVGHRIINATRAFLWW